MKLKTVCLSTVNVCVLPFQIYRPDSCTFSDQTIIFNPFLVEMYCLETNKDVLFKFISKEIFKLFIFSLRTNLVCKTYNLVCKMLKRYMINFRCIGMNFICQKVVSYKMFLCFQSLFSLELHFFGILRYFGLVCKLSIYF